MTWVLYKTFQISPRISCSLQEEGACLAQAGAEGDAAWQAQWAAAAAPTIRPSTHLGLLEIGCLHLAHCIVCLAQLLAVERHGVLGSSLLTQQLVCEQKTRDERIGRAVNVENCAGGGGWRLTIDTAEGPQLLHVFPLLFRPALSPVCCLSRSAEGADTVADSPAPPTPNSLARIVAPAVAGLAATACAILSSGGRKSKDISPEAGEDFSRDASAKWRNGSHEIALRCR